MIGGRVSKAHNNLLLTVAVIKRTLGLNLVPQEQRVELRLKSAQVKGSLQISVVF